MSGNQLAQMLRANQTCLPSLHLSQYILLKELFWKCRRFLRTTMTYVCERKISYLAGKDVKTIIVYKRFSPYLSLLHGIVFSHSRFQCDFGLKEKIPLHCKLK